MAIYFVFSCKLLVNSNFFVSIFRASYWGFEHRPAPQNCSWLASYRESAIWRPRQWQYIVFPGTGAAFRGTTTAKNRTFWHWAAFRSKDACSGTGATFRGKTTITNRSRSQNNGNRSYFGTTKEPDREGPRLTRKLTKTSFNGGSVFGDQNLQGFRLHRRSPQVWHPHFSDFNATATACLRHVTNVVAVLDSPITRSSKLRGPAAADPEQLASRQC